MTDMASRTPPGGPEDRLLGWRRVQDMAGISRSTAWRLQRAGDFPAPVQVSPGRVAWWESELTAWKGARGATVGLAPPKRPRLPGMPRRTTSKPTATAPAPSRQISLGLEEAHPPPEPARSKRKPRRGHADQIDFGF